VTDDRLVSLEFFQNLEQWTEENSNKINGRQSVVSHCPVFGLFRASIRSFMTFAVDSAWVRS
jgi:hypothetical protein